MPTIEDVLTIGDVETIRVMADERRLTILNKLQKSMTVKELAELLNCPVSQLYYHVNLLEKHKLIQVVATQIVSGIIEKQYQVTARVFRIRNPLLLGDSMTAEESSTLLAGLLDETKSELLYSFRSFPPTTEPQPSLHPFLARKEVMLTEEQLRHFHTRLDELVKDCDRFSEQNIGKEAQRFGLTIVFYQDVDTSGLPT